MLYPSSKLGRPGVLASTQQIRNCIIGWLSEFVTVAGLASPGTPALFFLSAHQASRDAGDITTRKCVLWATAEFSKSLIKHRWQIWQNQIKNNDCKFRRKVFKGKCKTFKILKPSLLGQGIPVEESGWSPRKPPSVTFWPPALASSWGEKVVVVLSRQLSINWQSACTGHLGHQVSVPSLLLSVSQAGSVTSTPLLTAQPTSCLCSLAYHFDFVYILSQMQIWSWNWRFISLDFQIFAQCYCGSSCFILL